MQILLNGTPREVQTGTCIQELFDQLRLNCLQVVVEHNRRIIPRQRLATTPLQEGDTLEVIHFVGGG